MSSPPLTTSCDLPCQNLPIILRNYTVSASIPGTRIIYSTISLTGNEISSTSASPRRTWNFVLKALVPSDVIKNGEGGVTFTLNLSNVQSQGYNVAFEDKPDGILTLRNGEVLNARRYVTYDVIDQGAERYLTLSVHYPSSCTKKSKKPVEVYLNINLSDIVRVIV